MTPEPADARARGARARLPLRPARLVRRHGSWAAPALLCLAIELHWLDRRSLWQDELATLSAARRPLPDLVRLLSHSDAVLGPYYLLLHVWTRLAGVSPSALRLPSALAMAAAVAVTAALAARSLGRVAGLTAGILLAIAPAPLLYGTEARAYAVTALLAATATALLVRGLLHPGRRVWAVYAAALVLLGWTQVTALTVVGAHLLAVAAMRWTWPSARRPVRATAGAAAVAVLAAVPFLLVGFRQSHQVGWIPRPTPGRLVQLPAQAWGSAGMGWVVIAVGLTALLLWTALPRPDAPAATDRPADTDPLPGPDAPPPLFCAALGAAVGVVPVLLIGLVSLVTPLTIPRYVLFTVTGWALLAATAVPLAKPLGRAGLVVPVALLAACLAVSGTERAQVGGSERASQPDYRALAAQVRAHGRPGDAIVVPTASGRRFRIGLRAYLGDAPWPRDVLVVADAVSAQRLDDRECEPTTCLGRPVRLWVGCQGTCRDPLVDLQPETRALIRSARYRAVGSWRAGAGLLTLLELPPGR